MLLDGGGDPFRFFIMGKDCENGRLTNRMRGDNVPEKGASNAFPFQPSSNTTAKLSISTFIHAFPCFMWP